VTDSALPPFVDWPAFPFEGDLHIRPYKPHYPTDRPRFGEPGGRECPGDQPDDDDYIWADELFRVMAGPRQALPAVVELRSRAHADLHELDPAVAAALGPMIVRIDQAMRQIPGVARAHIARWGDGGAHFHMHFFARPTGASQLIGWNTHMWAAINEPTSEATWTTNLKTLADALANGGGIALI
jgi:diadenosine tetraphosphate (Ap4A) HIT family hydrolase